jgi:Zn-dependent peptidase ImmA (M78 family)
VLDYAFLQNEDIRKLAELNATTTKKSSDARVPAYRIVLNDRPPPSEQFVTLAHELAHIFCGHLGQPEKEIEAEAAAFQVASRAGLVTRSAAYLASHVREAEVAKISLEWIVRAGARIERLAKIHYGSMAFKAT